MQPNALHLHLACMSRKQIILPSSTTHNITRSSQDCPLISSGSEYAKGKVIRRVGDAVRENEMKTSVRDPAASSVFTVKDGYIISHTMPRVMQLVIWL
ncbi:hypothetical protein BaRGS_00013703 [Batillaria attramentaria]|uniref:Uncharacterized protein n=1 Tax=Batillaria attramentaria TaxID=370345 RepID=A0ABD0L709_9CAEN